MTKDTLITGLIIAITGGTTYAIIKELRYRKLQKEMHEQIEEAIEYEDEDQD